MRKPFKPDQVWLDRIVSQLNGIEFGCVQITIHDGKIVQIERTEKKRYDQQLKADKEWKEKGMNPPSTGQR